MEFVSVEKKDSVAVLTWRHEEQNRFTTPFLTEVLDSLEELEQDERVRGVVIASGLEKHWCQGLLLKWMFAQSAKDPELLKQFLHVLLRLMIKTTGYPKPLVGAINGHATGAGAILATAFDYRLMNESHGKIRFPEVQIGVPFWPGMMALMKDVIPAPSLRDFVYTARPFTSAQAKEMGFIDELCPLENLVNRAVELTGKLATGDLYTYRVCKHQIRGDVLSVMENEDPKSIITFVENITKS